MLLAIRDRISGLLAWVLVIVISIPFALWGIQEYVRVGNDASAIVVNGKEITQGEYNSQYSNNRQMLVRSFGGRIPEFFNDTEFLRKQTIDTLTERALMDQLADESKFRVSNAAVISTITGLPSFQIDGKFDQKAYENQLKSNGMSARGFENEIRTQIVMNQVRQGISLTAFVSKKEIEQQARIKYQVRDVDYMVLPADAYNKDITVSDAEISDYYGKNKSTLKTDEQVSVEYVSLSLAEQAAKITVTEEQLRQQYADDEKSESNMITGETRNASHILVRVPADATSSQVEEKQKRAQAVYERVRKGEDFATVAKTESDDPGSATQGGGLGDVGRGVMVKPFEDALFGMKEGEISGPVKTTFGFHIIKLHSVAVAKKMVFEEARATLEKEYRDREAEKIFGELSDALATKAFENQGSLEPVVEATGLKLQTSDKFTKLIGAGIANFQPVREAAFSENVLGGKNSDVIELESNHVVVLRVKEHFPSREKTLEEAREGIRILLVQQKTENSIKTAGEKLKAAVLEKGASAALAAEYNGTFKSEKELKRSSGGAPYEILTEVFRMQAPQDGSHAPKVSGIKLGDGGYAVIVLRSVKQGDIAWIDSEEKNQLRNEMTEVAATRAMEMLTTSLKDKAKIVVNVKE